LEVDEKDIAKRRQRLYPVINQEIADNEKNRDINFLLSITQAIYEGRQSCLAS
jgi:hypothetical protein